MDIEQEEKLYQSLKRKTGNSLLASILAAVLAVASLFQPSPDIVVLAFAAFVVVAFIAMYYFSKLMDCGDNGSWWWIGGL